MNVKDVNNEKAVDRGEKHKMYYAENTSRTE